MKKSLLFIAAALMCMAVNAQTVLFQEDFNSVDTASNGIGAVPSTWTTYGDGFANNSAQVPFGDSWAIYGHFTEYDLCAVSCSWLADPTNVCDRWLITPAIVIPDTIDTVGGLSVALIFDASSQDPSYLEHFIVKVSNTDTTKASFTTTLMNMTSLPGRDFVTYKLPLNDFIGDTIYIAFINASQDMFFARLDNVMVTTFASYGIEALAVEAPLFAENGSATVNAYVSNTGVMPITSYDFSYTVDGVATTGTVNNINIAAGAEYLQTITLTGTSGVEYLTSFTVSNPNNAGNIFADTIADTTFINFIAATAPSTSRISLLENFTTQGCQYCPGGHDRINSAIANYTDNVAWVAHHSGYGTDSMTTYTDYYLQVLYGGSTWAPAMSLDRDRAFVDPEDDPGVVGSVGAVADLRAAFAAATAKPAYATIEIADVEYDTATRELTATVQGHFTTDLALDMPFVNLYLLEDSLMHIQANSATQSYIMYQHNHVLRDNIPFEFFGGTSSPYAQYLLYGDFTVVHSTLADSTFSATYTFTLPDEYRAHKCSLVAFINNWGDNYSRMNVLNAAKTGYIAEPPVVTPPSSINSADECINLQTYPNPATEMAYISAKGQTIRTMQVVNSLGQVVMSNNSVNADVIDLNVQGLAAGTYFITIGTDKGTATERLTVVK